ncbi:MAG: polyhydroxyalkanoic acid synthase [Rhodospirillales bacterium]|jgi:DNA-binding FrmR family transcriptional regulator|nr:polyhydroxyalkanoic acid synthase [Rhodospirillales bacterium]
MLKPLEITISHTLGRVGARRRVEESLAKIRGQLAGIASSVEQEWDGDRLRFRIAALGQTITGEIEVLEDMLRIVVALPSVLGLLGGEIAERVRHQATLLLMKS